MNTLKYKLLFAAATLILPFHSFADTIEDGRYWFALTTQGKLPVDN